MYKLSDFNKNSYRVGELARILGVSTRTIRRWSTEGKLPIKRTEGGHRIILHDDLIHYLHIRGMLEEEFERRDVVYARVDSLSQKSDLDRQVLYIVENAEVMMNPLILRDVGSSADEDRVNIKVLLRWVCDNSIRNVYVLSKDILANPGFNYINFICELHDTHIVCLEATV